MAQQQQPSTSSHHQQPHLLQLLSVGLILLLDQLLPPLHAHIHTRRQQCKSVCVCVCQWQKDAVVVWTFSSSLSGPAAACSSSTLCCSRTISSCAERASTHTHMHILDAIRFNTISHLSVWACVTPDPLTRQCVRNSCSCCLRFSLVVTRVLSWSRRLEGARGRDSRHACPSDDL